jgi:hypothetical protein
MKKSYYRVETQVDCEGVVHMPYATVALLVEVACEKFAPVSDHASPGPDEMAAAMKTAEDIIRVKYPIENASYCMKKPILENNPSPAIKHGKLITTSDGSKGWLLTSEMSDLKA